MLLGYWTKTTIFSFFWYHHSPGSHQKSQCLRSLTDWLTHSLTVTTSRASCDAKNKPCLQSSSLPFFSRSRGLVNRVCLAPVSLLSDCFLTRGSCTDARAALCPAHSGRSGLVGPSTRLFTTIIAPAKPNPATKLEARSVACFWRSRPLPAAFHFVWPQKLSAVVVRFWCNAFNQDPSRVVAKPRGFVPKSDCGGNLTGLKHIL